jgi:hypothetical protein
MRCGLSFEIGIQNGSRFQVWSEQPRDNAWWSYNDYEESKQRGAAGQVEPLVGFGNIIAIIYRPNCIHANVKLQENAAADDYRIFGRIILTPDWHFNGKHPHLYQVQNSNGPWLVKYKMHYPLSAGDVERLKHSRKADLIGHTGDYGVSDVAIYEHAGRRL